MSVDHSLLTLLKRGPDSASGLHSSLPELPQETWPLSMGQIAQRLDQLENNGLVEHDTTPGHESPRYRLTRRGRAEVDDWLLRATVRAPDGPDELLLKISLVAAEDGDLIPLLDAQRHALYTRLREVTRISAELPAVLSTDRLQAERRIFDLEAEVRFLDRVEALHRDRNRP